MQLSAPRPDFSDPAAGLIAQIDAILAAPPPGNTTFLVTGKPGSGKSSIIKALRRHVAGAGLLLIDYDFYPIANFRASRIEQHIRNSIVNPRPAYRPHFTTYDKAVNELTIKRVSAPQFAISQDETRKLFVEAYNLAADEELASGRPIVLLIDSAEYAVDLSDDAMNNLLPAHREANWGGEYWLCENLPKLRNTIIIVAGTSVLPYEQELDGTPTPVRYFERLQVPSQRQVVTQPYTVEQSRHYARQLLESVAAASDAPRCAGRAAALELSDERLAAWDALAGGSPFWLTICVSAELLGYAVQGQGPEAQWALMRTMFLDGDGDAQDELCADLRKMTFLRKGLSRELLGHLGGAASSFGELRALPVVRSNQGLLWEFLLLHDEVFRQVDRHAVKAPAEGVASVIGWYSQQIHSKVGEHRAIVSLMLNGTIEPFKEQWNGLLLERTARLDERHQLELERMSYYFDVDEVRGTQEYNVVAYNAIMHRNYGMNVLARQEGQRSIYRLNPQGMSDAVEIECAARWMLRAAHVEPSFIPELRQRLNRHYVEKFQPDDYPGPFAFLCLAEAQALLLGYATFEEHRDVARLLDEARRLAQRLPNDNQSPWNLLLRAQIDHWRGIYFGEQYQFQEAISSYRSSLDLAALEPLRSRGLQAFTLANLAAAYGEQGEFDDARRFGREALLQLQHLASDLHVALTYVILARIEIRGGRPIKALTYANSGVQRLKELDTSDRLVDGLLVKAEALRKAAEDREDDRFTQLALFREAESVIAEVAAMLNELRSSENPTSDQRHQSRQRECDLLQLEGCLHRSRSRVYTELRQFALAAADHDKAVAALSRAKALAVTLPPLVQIDVDEDLAAAMVNAVVEAPATIEGLLRQAQQHVAQPYFLDEERGLRSVPRPISGFWRELGQCEFQFTLLAFRRLNEEPPSIHSDELLQQIGEHLFKSFAYLTRHARSSTMQTFVEDTVLRYLFQIQSNRPLGAAINPAEPRLGAEQALMMIASTALATAKRFRLQDSEAHRRVEELIRKARRDRSIANISTRQNEVAP